MYRLITRLALGPLAAMLCVVAVIAPASASDTDLQPEHEETNEPEPEPEETNEPEPEPEETNEPEPEPEDTDEPEPEPEETNEPEPEPEDTDEPESDDSPHDTDRTVNVPEHLPFPDGSLNGSKGAGLFPDGTLHGYTDAGLRNAPRCWHIILCSSDDRVETQTEYQNCQSSWIDSIGINFDIEDTTYESIHIDYSSWRVRWYALSITRSASLANAMYDGMLDCIDDHNWDVQVRSWSAIWQQLHCHIFYQPAGGPSWDLEGYRSSNWLGCLIPTNECSQ